MNIVECYEQLGLKSGASLSEVKASYRRLARQYHPDVNPNNQQAQQKFMAVTEAYKTLLTLVPQMAERETVPKVEKTTSPEKQVKVTTKKTTTTTKKIEFVEPLSEADQKLKQNAYLQLQDLLKHGKYPRSIALIEGLAQRLPQDAEVKQWQAIVYQRWGRYLIADRQLDKARIYLKKALRTDPHNRALWAEIEQDFRNLEKLYKI